MACARPRLALLALLAAGLPIHAEGGSPQVEELVAWLSGTFDSKNQADLDPDYQVVRMVTVAVPKSRLSFGAPVLYREQATLDRTDRPYLQRFLRIEEDPGGTILVRLFELKDPIAAAGKWRDASDLALFGKNDVRERDGCLVSLRRVGDLYEGGTSGKTCVSSVGGAAYTTSKVRIWKDRIETWDRGFDGDGTHVWGPAKGAYHFLKRSAGVPDDTVSGTGQVPALPVLASPAAAASREAPAPPAQSPASRTDVADLPERNHPGEVSLFGLGQRTVLSVDRLRANPAATTVRAAGEGATFRGVPLATLLNALGIPSDGAAARRALASAVLVATGSDDSVSAFSAEEIFLSKDSFFLVFEQDGKALESDGPLMLFDVKSPSRVVRRLQRLEWRILAAPPSGSPAP